MVDPRSERTPPANGSGSEGIFDNVVVGIDETPESLVAAAQARVLCEPDGRLMLLAVAETYLAAHAGLAAAAARDDLIAGTSAALERAAELVQHDETRLASGRLVDLLRAECRPGGATLIAVGVRPHRRLSALTFGGHDVDALHDARCSVLISRPGWGPSKPDRIVVGVDGSSEASAAEVTARSLADRLGCQILPVVALGDQVDPAVLRRERDDALVDPRGSVEAVAAASSKSGLIVVGRGRQRGRRWGSSLAERIAYSARCSVLVVRDEPDAAE